jgi:two-component system sensor histidine kinase KdpD
LLEGKNYAVEKIEQSLENFFQRRNAPFYAVFVNDPDRFLTKAKSLNVETCEKLCQEFNGQFLRVNGTNIAKAISEVAKQYRITQIALGESQQSRWRLLLGGYLIQQLVRSLKHVDLHIIVTEKSGLSN